jgi:hypothetical protein
MAKRTTKMSELVGVRFLPEQFDAIEQWRREQPKIPQRPEAIRILVEEGLASFKRKGEKPAKGKK